MFCIYCNILSHFAFIYDVYSLLSGYNALHNIRPTNARPLPRTDTPIYLYTFYMSDSSPPAQTSKPIKNGTETPAVTIPYAEATNAHSNKRGWLAALPWLAFIAAMLALILAILVWIQHRSVSNTLLEQTKHNAVLQNAYQSEAVRIRDLESTIKTLESSKRKQELLLQSYQERLSQLESSEGIDKSQGVLVNLAGTLRIAEQHSTLTGKKAPVETALLRIEQELNALPDSVQVQLLAAVKQDIGKLQAQTVDSYAINQRITALLQNSNVIVWHSSPPNTSAQTKAQNTTSKTNNTKTDIKADTKADEEKQASIADWHSLITSAWWETQWNNVENELADLIRISDLEAPSVAILTPDAKEHIQTEYRLLLMQSRISLMSQDYTGAEQILRDAKQLLRTYTDLQKPQNQPTLKQLESTVADLKILAPSTADATHQAFKRLLNQVDSKQQTQ